MPDTFCETIVPVEDFDAARFGEDFGCNAPATQCSVYMSTGKKGEECRDKLADADKDDVMFRICNGKVKNALCQADVPPEDCLQECACENRGMDPTYRALAYAQDRSGAGKPDNCWWSPCFPEEAGTWKASNLNQDASCPTICSIFEDIRNPSAAVINILNENECSHGRSKKDDRTDTGGGEADADFDWRKEARERAAETTKWVSENPLTTIGLVLIAIIAIIALTAVVS